MKQNIASLQQIYDKITELNRKNNLLIAKYENDAKYARTHKCIVERGNISKRESEIHETLLEIKNQVDEKVLINTKLLNNESFFYGVVINEVIKSFNKTGSSYFSIGKSSGAKIYSFKVLGRRHDFDCTHSKKICRFLL